jgi:hypothetical protein
MTRIDEAIRHPSGGESTVPGRRVAICCLAVLSVATAVIHFAVAGSHFQEYWAFGVFMLAAAWLQLLWAAVAVARPSRLLLWSGVILNAGVVAVYIVTRTIGDVIGPTPDAVETAGFGDVLCTVLEAVVAVSCAVLLIAKMDRQVPRRQLISASAATGAVTAVLLSAALVAGGPEMVMSMSPAAAAGTSQSGTTQSGTSQSGTSPAMPMTGTNTSSIKLATASPAGDITMPDPSMQMPKGMAMASSAACTAAPTAQQQQAAVSLVNASWQGARKYQSLAAAKAAGYRPVTPTGARVVHYINPSYYRDTVLGGAALNTAQPQSLVYANTPKGAVLAAAMYITSPGGATPQPGGCLTQWHVHTNLCLSGGLGVVGAVNAAHPNCPAGSVNRRTPPMMHVWFVPIPGGPTAVDAPNSQVVQAAEQVTAPANGTA